MSDPTVRLDPARATEIQLAGTDLECVLVFKRALFIEDGGVLKPEIVPSAAVVVPWEVIAQMRDMLSQALSERERKVRGVLQ